MPINKPNYEVLCMPFKVIIQSPSAQDGGVDRYASPPHTTTESITTRSQKQKTSRAVRKLSCREVQQPRI